MKTLQILLTATLAALSISACASGSRLTDKEKLELYRAHAKAPVQSFRYLSRIDGWTPLGESAVAIWTRPNEAYLLDVDTPCPDLNFAQAIGVTSQVGAVYARFDKVIPRMFGGGRPEPIPCYIRQIRPLDVKGLKAAEHEMREQSKQASS